MKTLFNHLANKDPIIMKVGNVYLLTHRDID